MSKNFNFKGQKSQNNRYEQGVKTMKLKKIKSSHFKNIVKDFSPDMGVSQKHLRNGINSQNQYPPLILSTEKNGDNPHNRRPSQGGIAASLDGRRKYRLYYFRYYYLRQNFTIKRSREISLKYLSQSTKI